MRKHLYILLTLCNFGLGFLSCGNNNHAEGPVYSNIPPASLDTEYSIHVQGLMNVSAMMDVFAPMAHYLEEQLPGKTFKIEPVSDFDQFRSFTLKENPALIIANPVEVLNAMDSGYEVIATVGEQNFSQAVLLVPDTSHINNLANLWQKRIVLPPSSAFIGSVVPEFTLYRYNPQLYRTLQINYLSSIESPVYVLLEQKADAAFLTYFSWDRFQRNDPVSARKLRVIFKTDSVAAPAVLINSKMNKREAEKIKKLLITFNQTPGGKAVEKAFGSTPFLSANNNQYQQLIPFIRQFEQEIRPLYKN